MLLGARQTIFRKSIIPSNFKQIMYLDTNYPNNVTSSNIPAYILTDITGVSGDKIFIQIECIHRVISSDRSINGEWNFLIGAEFYDNETNHIKIRRSTYVDGKIGLCGTANDTTNIQLEYNTPYIITLNGSQLSTNPGNMQVTTYPYNGLTTTPLGIGGCELVKQKYDGYYRVWKGLIGHCIIKYDNILIGDFIPVLNLQTNIYGYYDLVQKKFYQSVTNINFKEGFL